VFLDRPDEKLIPTRVHRQLATQVREFLDRGATGLRTAGPARADEPCLRVVALYEAETAREPRHTERRRAGQ
jgi:hypothetical protein